MIDLQIHTTDSDGTWAWDRVLEACLGLNLAAFAITDHDTLIRRDSIRAWAQSHGAPAIPGLELSANENNQSVHLLGYFFEGPLEKLQATLTHLREARRDRNSKILSKLRGFGFDVTEESLQEVAKGETVGRPHIARLLLQKGFVTSLREAFDRFLAAGSAAYVAKEEVPLREGIELLKNAGAVTSVAHPILLGRSLEELEQSFERWKSWGLDALEAYYPTYTIEQGAFLRRMVDKYGFLATGGSDFHGENKPHLQLGTGYGSLLVPDHLLPPLLERRDQIIRQLM